MLESLSDTTVPSLLVVQSVYLQVEEIVIFIPFLLFFFISYFDFLICSHYLYDELIIYSSLFALYHCVHIYVMIT